MQLKSFLEYLQVEKRYSQHTLSSYQNDLSQFGYFLTQVYDREDWYLAQHHEIRSWVVDLMERDFNTRSVNRKISSLKSFFRFAKKQGWRQDNPMQKIISPKVEKRIPIFVEEDKLNSSLDSPEIFGDGYAGARNRAIVELLYGTGMRRSELIGLKEIDVDHNQLTIKVLGKRNKERLVPMSRGLSGIIKAYEEKKRDEFGAESDPFLLLTDKGRKLYPKFVYRIVNDYLGKVTTITKKSPHILRHSFATHLLNRGADLNAIKEILGHANLAATQVYTHNSIDKLKNIHKIAHPKG